MIRAVLHWVVLLLPWIVALMWFLNWRTERTARRLWEETAHDWERLTLAVMRGGRDMAASILAAQQAGLLEEHAEELALLVRDLDDRLAQAEEHIV